LTSKPTTIAGYGITDAANLSAPTPIGNVTPNTGAFTGSLTLDGSPVVARNTTGGINSGLGPAGAAYAGNLLTYDAYNSRWVARENNWNAGLEHLGGKIFYSGDVLVCALMDYGVHLNAALFLDVDNMPTADPGQKGRVWRSGTALQISLGSLSKPGGEPPLPAIPGLPELQAASSRSPQSSPE
jgi:hypothetical protein